MRARIICATWVSCCVLLLCLGCSPEPNAKRHSGLLGEVSVAHLKSLYKGYPVVIDKEASISGVVISSDRMGNFAHSIVIEDATGGIEVKVASADLFLLYHFGVTVTLDCNGLTLGSYGGSLQIGGASGQYEVGLIAADVLSARLKVTDPQQIVPAAHTLTIPNLSPRYVNCWVRLEQVQFIAEESGLGWGDAAGAVDRHLIDRSADTLAVRVAGGDMVSVTLPGGSGYIEGVLGYFNGRYQLRPVNPLHADMESERF